MLKSLLTALTCRCQFPRECELDQFRTTLNVEIIYYFGFQGFRDETQNIPGFQA